ncbi:glycoside hydrolase family 76 protein [Psychromicrobium lacuslunae]|uniref:Glycosyl hydrolase n=1 Tax=Psychromicrobium lacuslunae TaxID=1618207 RepID=A0A0D4C1D5_9MICC|nr:glycoside hydrolase family 76 protein [Psychromicrobium lacuslunae]AJT42156.1 glycosyl hydrolase [Psychromicrobium lacuslunae]
MTSAEEWAARAAAAGAAVNTRFGHRLFGLPGTWLGRISSAGVQRTEWHYWWQAHYLDCLVDAGWREYLAHENEALRLSMRRIKALPRTIRLRNFLRFSNSFFDDMAWLALAAGRADALRRKAEGKALPQARAVRRSLEPQLRKAFSDELGGGMFWSKQRDYKNAPVNGPGALYFARTGDASRAQRILDWMREYLWDPERQLYIDGVHLRLDGPEREETIWSYNQGPVLGALCALPTPENLVLAAEVIDGVERGLLDNGALRLHGDGDPGLFTGILARYLSIAARTSSLPESSRSTARQMVFDTAEALWESRSSEQPLLFTDRLGISADQAFPGAGAVDLSTQLQAWMIFEVAHQLALA